MAVIKNYGLRWVRDRVDWGSPGRKGCLAGVLKSQLSADPVDFRDQIGIYVLYETGFIPVYIGQAGFGKATLFERLKSHRKDHLRDRWTHFSWFGFRGVNSDGSLRANQDADAKTSFRYKDALDEFEGLLIQVLEPRLNRQGPAWQKTADEYLQAGLPAEGEAIQEIRKTLQMIESRLSEVLGKGAAGFSDSNEDDEES